MAAAGDWCRFLLNRLPVNGSWSLRAYHVYVSWAVESASFVLLSCVSLFVFWFLVCCFSFRALLLSYKKYIYTNNNNTYAILFGFLKNVANNLFALYFWFYISILYLLFCKFLLLRFSFSSSFRFCLHNKKVNDFFSSVERKGKKSNLGVYTWELLRVSSGSN